MRRLIALAILLAALPTASALCGVNECIQSTTALADATYADSARHAGVAQGHALNATAIATSGAGAVAACASAGDVGCANAALNDAGGAEMRETNTAAGRTLTYLNAVAVRVLVWANGLFG